MHSDCIVEVYASKEDAQKSAEGRDKVDNDANYYVESHVVIGASDRIERMRIEESELKDRIKKLVAFMESDEFAALDETEKRLLRNQYCGMETYLTSLGSRLVNEDLKRYQAEIQAMNAQIPDLKAQGKTDEEIAMMFAEQVTAFPKIDFTNMLPMLMFGSNLFGGAKFTPEP